VFERLDPRARILIVVTATLVVASTPKAELTPFLAYFPLSVLMILMSRASGLYLFSRCLAASPFILLAAGLLAFQAGLTSDGRPAGIPDAVSVLLKGYSAALLLAFLTATTALSELLWALRKLKAPESLNVILGVMYRYTNLLSEEYSRLERARESRTVRPLGRRRFAVYGRQLATLFIRSWDRADRVHAAMLSRGYNGGWPSMESRRFTLIDTTFLIISSLLFLASRWLR
jgi:cobalt/nickel transport system permease protein